MSKTLTLKLKQRVIQLILDDMEYQEPGKIVDEVQDYLYEEMDSEEKWKAQFIKDGLPGFRNSCYGGARASDYLGDYFRNFYLYAPERLLKSEAFVEKANKIRFEANKFLDTVNSIKHAVMKQNNFTSFKNNLPRFVAYLDKARDESRTGGTELATVINIPDFEMYLKSKEAESGKEDSGAED